MRPGATSTEWQRTSDKYYVWLQHLDEFQGEKAEYHRCDHQLEQLPEGGVQTLRRAGDRLFLTHGPIVVGKPDLRLPVDVRVDVGQQRGARTSG